MHRTDKADKKDCHKLYIFSFLVIDLRKVKC